MFATMWNFSRQPMESPLMPFLDHFHRVGARYRLAANARRTRRIMNALPPEIQRDLDWNPPPSTMASIYRAITASIRR
ncbi:hypothetical protein RB623_02875 [Mesorhizobium sp. LHD-90]|uniref:hypothetical protein n=1 Tax=Mesorhizobium sp. LHD-90 TaxID=3071414 RepID=UPI0027E03300|nr:hypothetical protein [Mesorhizobium sp. LHD-90]MDQ6432997.1 hypothetical protein [Mesorhizobium sp. LHD-90]